MSNPKTTRLEKLGLPVLKGWEFVFERDSADRESVRSVIGSFADFFDGTEKIYSAPHPFTIKGKVYGRTGYNDGDKIYTSNIVSIERAFKPSPKDYFSGKYSIDEIADFMENDIFIATTQSGSKYAFEKKALGANMYMYLGTWSNGF